MIDFEGIEIFDDSRFSGSGRSYKNNGLVLFEGKFK